MMFHIQTTKNCKGWSQVKESRKLLKDVVEAFLRQYTHIRSGRIYLDVENLRDHCKDLDLEIDGSREVLINQATNFGIDKLSSL
mmetsp:Transcript_417/g.954  ORF Transcript_417/g.954 Transcript_417/m.954 type:complete len:84 (+) Transcript_417:1157-1408(+)